MANHKSAIKKIRSDYTKNQHNRYLHKTVRNAINKLKTGQVSANQTELIKVFSMIDKLVKKNILHKNKAANLKSKLSKLSGKDITASPKISKNPKKKTPSVSKKTKVSEEINSTVEEAPIEESSVEESSVE